MTKSDASFGRHYGVGGGNYIFTSDIGGTCAVVEDPTATNNIWNCSKGFLNGVLVLRDGISIIMLNMTMDLM